VITNPCCGEQSFPYLRSLDVTFAPKCIANSERAYLVDQILHASPRLEYLAAEWKVLRRCSKSNGNVRHLSLRLNKHPHDPSAFVDVGHLGQLLPNLRCLKTSDGHLALNDNLVRFIVSIVDTFDRLLELVLNAEGRLPIEKDVDLILKRTILSTGNRRLTNSDACQINFPRKDTVAIWLS
jgi:hypothetical protein